MENSIINKYSSLSLAYLGDSVYESYIRTRLLENSDFRVKELHRKAKSYVSAKAQSAIIEKIVANLTDVEITIYKRGRNTKVNTKAKNALTGEYHSATGFEALIGYLYLNKETVRLKEILDMAYEVVE